MAVHIGNRNDISALDDLVICLSIHSTGWIIIACITLYKHVCLYVCSSMNDYVHENERYIPVCNCVSHVS